MIEEIVTVSLHLNKALYEMYKADVLSREEKNPVLLEKIRLEIEKQKRTIALWKPRLADMRRYATYYIRASSFVNKDHSWSKIF